MLRTIGVIFLLTSIISGIIAQDIVPPSLTVTYNVREDASIGDTVTTFSAVDPDSLGVQFSLQPSSTQFDIDASTGILTVTSPLDYEIVDSYQLTVVATETRSDGMPAQSDFLNISINILDINEDPPLLTLLSQNQVGILSPPGTFIAAFQCVDGMSSGSAVTYSITDPSNQFSIHSRTGVVSTLALTSLNVDVTNFIYPITVICTIDESSSLSSSLDVYLEIINEDVILPSITPTVCYIDTYHSVYEDAPVGTFVHTYQATDPDTPDLQFSLTGTTAFAIDSETGVIRVAEDLDYEIASSYTVTVTVTEVRIIPGTPRGQSISVFIGIRDRNDDPPVFNRTDVYLVGDESLYGVIAGRFRCIDGDPGRYATIRYSMNDTSEQFDIDYFTGDIITTNVIELDDTSLSESYSVTVTCTEVYDYPYFSSSIMVSITTTKTDFSIREDTPVGTVIVTIPVVDPDSVDAVFNIPDDNGTFTINEITGTVQINSSLDYETLTSYQVTVMSTEINRIPQTDFLLLTIDIENFNEQLPVFTRIDHTRLTELATPGTIIGLVQCIDTDPNLNAPIVYSLSDPSGQFQIDSTVGVISIVNISGLLPVDINTYIANYTVTVLCTEDQYPHLSANVTIILEITKVDDITPTITTADTVYNVSENASISDIVTVINATDPDSSGIRFSLQGDGATVFSIDPENGTIKVGGMLDYESINSYKVTVVATEVRVVPGLPQNDFIILTISVVDVNDKPPVFTQADTFPATENSPHGTIIATTQCMDQDELNSTIVYTINDPSGQFVINPNIGTVTVTTLTPVDVNSPVVTYSVAVFCTETEVPFFQMNTTLSIEITKVDTDPPTITTNQTVYIISENAVIGDQVVTINAIDMDSAGIEFTLVGTATAAFSINSTTGTIQVNVPLDFETTTSYQATVTVTEIRVVPGIPQRDTIEITVIITDVNDEPPIFILTDVTAILIDSPPGTVAANTSCIDGDTDINSNITYSLHDPSGQFSIDTDGNVATVSLNDIDVNMVSALYVVTVTCTESDLSFSTNVTLELEIAKEDNIPPNITTIQTIHFVSESASIGDIITTITATDPDSAGVQFSLSGTGAFLINETSGALQVAAPLDYETTSSYQFTVTATEIRIVSGLPQMTSISLTINIENINELPPEFTQAEVIQRGELSPPGIVVANIDCRDGDLNINADVMFSLIDPSNQFAIDNSSGNITIVSIDPVNVNTYIQEYVVTVVCTERETPTFTTNTSVILEIRKEDVTPPVISALPSVYTVRENASIGDIVATITATDPDSFGVRFSIQGTGAFIINETSGILQVAAPLDYETTDSYQFTVTATEVRVVPGLPQSNSAEFTINIENVIDVSPELKQAEVFLRGDKSLPGTVVASIDCNNRDSNVNATVMFSLIDPSNQFALDNKSGNITIVSLNALDVNILVAEYSVTVICTEVEAPSFSSNITLLLKIFKEDNIPLNITTLQTVYSISETASIGDIITTITVTDPDSAGIQFSLEGTETFKINETSGILQVAAPLDYESFSSYQFTVIATEVPIVPRPALNDFLNLTVYVENVNEYPPVFTAINSEAVCDCSPSGTVIATVECRDGDINMNATVEYSFIDPSGQFSINTSTGVILTVSPLPLNSITYIQGYTVTVICTENQRPFFTNDAVITLEVFNEDAIPPQIQSVTAANTSYSVREDASVGSTIAVFLAVDPDSPAVQFSLEGVGATTFTIDSDTGTLQVGVPLDYENTTSYQITVVASEVRVAPGTPQRDTLMITITIENVNEFSPVFVNIDQKLLSEVAPVGAKIATVSCIDGDPNLNAPIEYSLNDTSNQFSIDNSTGDIVALALNPLHPSVLFFTTSRVSVSCKEKQEPFFTTSISISLLVSREARETCTPPSITTVETVYNVSENASIGNAIAFFTATDPDSTNVQFSLEGTGASDFTIDVDTGILRVGAVLDRESISSYQLMVIASEATLSPGTIQSDFLAIIVNVEDINDNSPSCGETNFNASIQAGSYNQSTVVFTFNCSDRDADENGEITYTLLHTSPATSKNRFIIISSSLVFEGKAEKSEVYKVTVRVADQGIPTLFTDVEVSITVEHSPTNITVIVVIAVIVFLTVLLLFCGLILWRRRQHSRKGIQNSIDAELEQFELAAKNTSWLNEDKPKEREKAGVPLDHCAGLLY